MTMIYTGESKVPWRFVEEDGRKEGGVSPCEPQDCPDNGPSSRSGRVCERSSRAADAAGDDDDAPRSRSPHRQEAWKTLEDPDIANPHPPRFIPKRRPGPQPPLTTSTQTPHDIFAHFFDAEVLEVLCVSTNKNAKKNLKKGKKFIWTDITPQELTRYLGMLLFMSVCNLPKMSDFWRQKNIFHVPFPALAMSRDRFRFISSNLYMSDPKEDVVNDWKKGTKEYDPLQKVRALLEIIRNRSKNIYHPKQNISVDERMVASKPRLSMKQYMKAKPLKWGHKFVVLTDVNGYTVDFRLDTRKNHGASVEGLSFDVVTQLVNKNYLGSGYVVYCDNLYTSPLLFRHLSQQGFGACGTYSPGKAGDPTTRVNALDKKSKRGSIRWIRDGDLLFVKWMDTREVSICTTVHPVYTGETVLRWQETADGPLQRVPVPTPTAVSEYNKYIGGVDTSDQMLGTNSVHRTTKRWPMRVFQHLLDIAVTNSFIVHKELSVSHGKRPMTRQAFQEQLCASLLGVPLTGPPKPPTLGHFPVPTNKREQIGKRQRASMGRKQCTVCHKSTPWMCEECNVGLCLQLDRNCFRVYHGHKKHLDMDKHTDLQHGR
ncbi:piggyBac transposable element-derived protein 4-like [Clinocottus analis]|uniref:piggyBac transposable element-derived protein 4-like n=1 Tax=Clinocottus analis TaxID=304258 RepID=UPI0035C18469